MFTVDRLGPYRLLGQNREVTSPLISELFLTPTAKIFILLEGFCQSILLCGASVG